MGWNKPLAIPSISLRACMLLKSRAQEQACKDYEYRPSHLGLAGELDEIPEWKGESLNGKTLLVCS